MSIWSQILPSTWNTRYLETISRAFVNLPSPTYHCNKIVIVKTRFWFNSTLRLNNCCERRHQCHLSGCLLSWIAQTYNDDRQYPSSDWQDFCWKSPLQLSMPAAFDRSIIILLTQKLYLWMGLSVCVYLHVWGGVHNRARDNYTATNSGRSISWRNLAQDDVSCIFEYL